MKKLSYTFICAFTTLTLSLMPGCDKGNTPSGQEQQSGEQTKPSPTDTTTDGNTEAVNPDHTDTDQDPDDTDIDPEDGQSDTTVVDIPTCPNCGTYGTCDENTLTCKCASQFTGSRCDQCAPRFTGPDCDDCADPDTYTGPACNICKDDHKEGSYCERCKKGYWGANCENTCDCPSGEFCQDGVNGDGSCSKCSEGKASSKNDGVCDICAPGYFGPNCEPCTCDAIGGICNDGLEGDGSCSCKTGFTGDKCTECEKGRYGQSCTACGCVNGTCNDGRTSDGSCDCKAGYFGMFCGKECECDTTNGICNDGAKGDGNCLECKADANGIVHWDVKRNCKECLQNWGEKFNGSTKLECQDCAPGYFGPTCEPCTWSNGNLCSATVSSNEKRKQCDYGVEGSGYCICGNGAVGAWCSSSCSKIDGKYDAYDCIVSHQGNGYGFDNTLYKLQYEFITIKTNPALNWTRRNVRWDGCQSCNGNKTVWDVDNEKTYIGVGCASCEGNTILTSTFKCQDQGSYKCQDKVTVRPMIQLPPKVSKYDSQMEEWLNDHEHNKDYLDKYGYFFSWEDAQKICPPGWRLPTEADLFRLRNFINSVTPVDTTVLMSPSGLWEDVKVSDISNDYGFDAEPGGYLRKGSTSSAWGSVDVGKAAYFWGGQYSGNKDNAAVLQITTKAINVVQFNKKSYRFPVRCVQM